MDPVVHFELPYTDADRITAFYEAVFGWKTQNRGLDLRLFDDKREAIDWLLDG